MTFLERIQGPRDLDSLTLEETKQLCSEIRAHLVNSVAKTGGHLGPNLGVVETTVAIHRVFDSPKDPIIFEGFAKRAVSPDIHNAARASTMLSNRLTHRRLFRGPMELRKLLRPLAKMTVTLSPWLEMAR